MRFYGANVPAAPDAQNGGPDLYASFFVDDTIGHVFGEFGVAFQTTDGGSSWQAGFVPGFTRINTAFFTSRDSGMVAGDNGNISFTTDGGASWFQNSLVSGLTTQDINHIEVNLTDSVAVMIGDSGTMVYVARDSTVLDVAHEHTARPQGYELSQNYPNPFNPTTVIRYSLMVNSRVTLKIYNVLGQEVATLADDMQSAGYKSVEWDASAFTSGMHFYRIQAGSFVETKKLILLK